MKLLLSGLVAITAAAAVMSDADARRRRDFNNGANYMGLDYQLQQLDVDATEQSFEPSSVRFRSGTMFDENFGYEAHLAVGTDSDTLGSSKAEVDYYYGFALRGQLPLSEQVAVYGLAGLGWTSYTQETSSSGAFGSSSSQRSATDSDFVYGGGVAMRLGRQAMLSAEWMSQLSNDEVDISSVNIGIARLF